MTSRITGIILAGGRSRRMGQDKCGLLLGNRTLLERVVERVTAVCDPVIVVARRASDYPDCAVPVIGDRWPGTGPLGGLITGLGATSTPYGALVACDLPFLEPALLAGLIDRRGGWDTVVPEVAGRVQPHCAVYARDILPLAESLFHSGGRSLHALVGAPGLRALVVREDQLRAWDAALRSFININTAEDAARARGLLADP